MTRNNHNTKNSLYRPKITKKTYNTIGRYCRFIKQFTDDNDWGYKKQHMWSWAEMEAFMEEGTTSHTLKTTYNYTLTFIKGNYFGQGQHKQKIESIDDIFLINKYSPNYPALLETWNEKGQLSFKQKRLLCIEHHLLAAQQHDKTGYLFYTCSPFKPYNLICCDVDNITSDEAYTSVVEFLSSLFPNSYYERSTNQTGLHFYILVEFDTTRMLFSDINEGVFRNILFTLLSDSLSSVINSNIPNVHFDAIKATCPVYDINKKFLKYGALVKLPAPVLYSQYKALYSASTFPEYYLICIINYLQDVSCHYKSGVYSFPSLLSSLSSLLKEYPIRTSPKEIISQIKKENQIETLTYTTSLPYTTQTNGGTKCLPSQKPLYDKNYTLMDIMNEGDSRRRESLYIKKYVRDYYIEHKTLPSIETVEAAYRKEMNYHKIGEFRKTRFKKHYDYTINTFDKNKSSDRQTPYKIGLYDNLIEKTDEELTQWVNINTGYKRKVYRYDVDITLEYILICSKNRMNKAREILIKKYAQQENMSLEMAEMQLRNTTPRKGLEAYFNYMSENQTIEGKKINKCDSKKASALFAVVVELGLCECIDDDYTKNKARKFNVSDTVRHVRDSWNTKEKCDEENVQDQGNSYKVYHDESEDKIAS